MQPPWPWLSETINVNLIRISRMNVQHHIKDSWVDEVHKNMMAELKTRRLGAERSSTETGKEIIRYGTVQYALA